MQNIISKNNASFIFPISLILVLGSSLIAYQKVSIQLIGYSSILVLSVISLTYIAIAILSNTSIQKKNAILLIFLLILSSLGAIKTYLGLPWTGLKLFLQILIIFSTIFLFYKTGKNQRNYQTAIILTILRLFLITLIFLAFINNTTRGYAAYFGNPNSLGLWVVSIIPILHYLTRNKYVKIFDFFICLCLVYLSSSRTALGAFFILYAYLITYKFWVTNRITYWIPIITLIIFSFLFIYLTLYSDLKSFNDLIAETTGKNLLSGRHRIWPATINLINEKPLLGWGAYTLSDLSDITLSPHNLFLYITLQGGYLGLIIYVSLILYIWSYLYKIRKTIIGILTIGGLLSIIFIQSSEVTLFQNNLGFSLPFWALLGIAFSSTNTHQKL